MFSLTSINLTNIGWAGGSTSTNWIRYFDSELKAKKAAEVDFGGKPLIWIQLPNCQQTRDLGHVMYIIKEIIPE